jgi:phosphoglycerate dehydrogenase-like enzyme
VPSKPVLVVEDDPWTRVLQVALDPATSAERVAAFADFMSTDVPDFAGWCERMRTIAGPLYPAEMRMAETQEDLRAALPEADAAVVEGLQIGAPELARAPRLRVVYRYGFVMRNIDTAACAARGIKVLTIRRRPNIACAEQAIGMMLMLARRMHRINGLISIEQVEAAGYPYKPFDRRHTAHGNWARIPGMRMLFQSTAGIIGLGEIGREIAARLQPFGMRVLYTQRTRLPADDESALGVEYASLDDLLAQSDWVIPQLPAGPGTRNLLNRERLFQMKRGACIVNVSRPDVTAREDLIEALRSGHLGGFALDAQYEEPGRSDDELSTFDNVVLMPHMAGSPRTNGLGDFEEMIKNLAREVRR